jgi:hypothetical protein
MHANQNCRVTLLPHDCAIPNDRFQADIAFDGEELARRALDRCGRTRLFKALDAAVRRHDPHALDALLMQFAAVIVSTTGAEVDRLEREIMVRGFWVFGVGCCSIRVAMFG